MKRKIKIKWTKDTDKSAWTGMLFPMFRIYKDRKQLYLDIMEPGRAPSNRHRQIEIKSVQQGKRIAAEMIRLIME